MKKLSLCLLVIILSISIPSFSQNYEKNDFEISKNLDIFATLYKQIHLNYVDDVKSGELMKTAIDAMLESLDPYTVYIPEADIEDYKFMTTGQYGGIGALIHRRGNYVYISEPYEGFPAQKSGLKAGDKIIEINGKPTKGKTTDEVSTLLKGTPGTTINLLYVRDSNQKPIEITITREEIKVENVPYSGIVKDKIGYINLTGFTHGAGKEVKDALLKLKDNGCTSVILDLRGNGGGLLNEAVNIVNIFVDKGQLVVSTKGKIKDKNNFHKTFSAATDINIPLVVLVDGGSASASEIVTGAIQDLDRGVIIGQRTFGKGLVQNIVPLSYNSEMKVTIAKYYIPSGRCIQAIDYANKDEEGNANKIPDSLLKPFKTLKGRTVYEGSGIEPDVVVEPALLSNISGTLVVKYLFFDFSVKYSREHASISSAMEFVITDEIYDEFIKFLQGKNYDYSTQSEKALKELKENAEKEKYFDAIKTEYEALKAKMMHDKNEDLVKFKDEIKPILKAYIAQVYYYQKGRIEASLTDDIEVKKAIEILNDKELYKSILDGTYKNGTKKSDKK
jgi:carboxyl-terminal processing protease